MAKYVCICVYGWVVGMQDKREIFVTIETQRLFQGILDGEELEETIEHFLCNSPALSRLRLKTLGKGFFESFNSVSRVDIKALYKFIIGSVRSAKVSLVRYALSCVFVGLYNSSASLFSLSHCLSSYLSTLFILSSKECLNN